MSQTKRNSHVLVPYAFEDGFPVGKVGLITSVNGVKFDGFTVADDAMTADMLGRWTSTSNTASVLSTGVLNPWADKLTLYSPVFAENVRLDEFQATFSVTRSGSNQYLWFCFDIKDQDDLNLISLSHSSSPTAPSGLEFVDGGVPTQITDPTASAPPAADAEEKLWFRVESVDGTVTVKCTDEDDPTENDWATASTCYTSSDFELSGGHIGFAYGDVDIDDLTIKMWDGQAWESDPELIETFDITDGHGGDRLTYDDAGNCTYDGRYAYEYDAWNRLTKVFRAYPDQDADGKPERGSQVATMAYDGLGRRITKTVINSGDLDECYHYYYDGQQVIEVRNALDQVLKQYVWGVEYIDELVQIGINQDPENADVSAPYDENLCERFFWALQDANFNILGVVASNGDLVERYEYTPYGQRTVYSRGWHLVDMTDDGKVDGADLSLYAADSQQTDRPASRADVTGDGQINAADLSLLASHSGQQVIADDPLCTHPRLGSFRFQDTHSMNPTVSLCEFGHQGLAFDREFGLIYNRARAQSPEEGRLFDRDPIDGEASSPPTDPAATEHSSAAAESQAEPACHRAVQNRPLMGTSKPASPEGLSIA